MDRRGSWRQADENQMTYFRFATLRGRGDADAADLADVVATDFIDHWRPLTTATTTPKGRRESRVVIQDLIADGDRLAARVVVERRGAPGDASAASPVEFIEIVRFRDGRIVERWCQPDRAVLAGRLTKEATPKRRRAVTGTASALALSRPDALGTEAPAGPEKGGIP